MRREASGPGGPRSLRALRSSQVLENTATVQNACDALLRQAVCPSIAKVTITAGLSTSTINRPHYKSIVRRAKRQYALMLTGLSVEEAAEQVDTVDLDHCVIDAPFPAFDYGQVPAAEPTHARELQTLLTRLESLTAEVARRDEQLYNALSTNHALRSTLRWHRENSAKLKSQIEALTSEPLPERSRKKWSDELAASPFDDDDDDDD